MINSLKDSAKYLVILSFFFVLTAIIFQDGIFSDKVLNQHDILQWRGGAQESIEYRENNGKEALWTNSMFSGMPAYLVSVKYWGDLIQHVQLAVSLGIPRPYSLVFLAMCSFFILLKTFKINPLIAAIGSMSYGATSFVTIGVLAGHNSRIAAIAFLPLVIAGVKLIFDGKYRWGTVLTALALALEIRVNHLQITYYLLLILLVYGIVELVFMVRKKDYANLKSIVPLLLIAVILGVGSNIGKLRTIVSYSKYSTRGQSELPGQPSGLEKDYAFEFSNSIAEPLVLFIPNFYGGASNQELSKKSNLALALKKQGLSRQQIAQNIKSVPTYWGDQRLSAPYYVGALIFFLAVCGFLIVDKKYKIWLGTVIVLGVVLSWGENFKSVNYFLFDYLPGYNKFRSVTFTILLSIFGLALLGSLGLQKLLIEEVKPTKKQILIALGTTAGLALFVALFSGMGSYKGMIDERLIAQQLPDWYVDAIRDDRQRLLRIDALRSAFIVIISATILWFYQRKKIGLQVTLLLLVGISSLDLITLNKRYVKDSVFQEDVTENYFQATPADQVILQSNVKNSRVLNLENPFNDAKTSYLHSSVGGYHGAKLGRYQDLISRQIQPEISELIGDLQAGIPNFKAYHILNMLNIGFFKYGPNQNNVIQNPAPNGNAWFVAEVITVNSALDEINELNSINTRNAAVIDQSKFTLTNSINDKDIEGTIVLNEKGPNRLVYSSNNSENGLAIFSEIYYPDGWKATINGNEVPIIRANYVLRALEVPAGSNEIIFTFVPSGIKVGNIIMFISGIIILLGFFIVLILEFVQRNGKRI